MFALSSCGGLANLFGPGPESEPEPEPSDYTVSIDGAFTSVDLDGNPAVVVVFTWQNNSDKEQMFATALDPRCYQDGVELEPGYMVEGCDYSENMVHVKPGGSNTVQQAFLIRDVDLPIHVEVRELMSLDDTVLASTTYTRKQS